MAAVSLTELISQAKDDKMDLHIIITLDAVKALDVVNHPIMLQTLYQKNIEPCLWRAIANLYNGMREKVTWQGTLSKDCGVRQGVEQGRTLSPLPYKVYMDGPLATLRESGHGVHIGTTYMGTPASADDVLLACGRDSAQPMLNIADDQACNRCFNIQPLKSDPGLSLT